MSRMGWGLGWGGAITFMRTCGGRTFEHMPSQVTPPAERPITQNSDQVEKSGFLDRITGSSIICPDGNRASKFAAERRGIPVQSVVHQVKNFTSEGPKMFRGVSNIAGTQTLDRSWKSLKDFLPAHMVLKHKDRGHSTMHPSVTQYVFMWYWRCT